MSVDYRIEPDTRTAVFSAAGTLTLADILSAMQAVYEDPRFTSPTRALWDLTQAEVAVTPNDLRTVAEFSKRHRPPGRGRAAIVASEDLTFGFGRMYEMLAADVPIEHRVFRAVEQAWQWLLADESGPNDLEVRQ